MRIAEQLLIGRSSVQITFMAENLGKSEWPCGYGWYRQAVTSGKTWARVRNWCDKGGNLGSTSWFFIVYNFNNYLGICMELHYHCIYMSMPTSNYLIN